MRMLFFPLPTLGLLLARLATATKFEPPATCSVLQASETYHCEGYTADGEPVASGGHANIYGVQESDSLVMKVATDSRGEDFHKECDVMKRLQHGDKLVGHVPQCYAVCDGDDGNLPRLVMDFLPSTMTLDKFLERNNQEDKVLMRKLGAQTFAMITQMVKLGVVDADRRPNANILVGEDGTVFFIDFGMACMRTGDFSCSSLEPFDTRVSGMVYTALASFFKPEKYYGVDAIKTASCCDNLILKFMKEDFTPKGGKPEEEFPCPTGSSLLDRKCRQAENYFQGLPWP